VKNVLMCKEKSNLKYWRRNCSSCCSSLFPFQRKKSYWEETTGRLCICTAV